MKPPCRPRCDWTRPARRAANEVSDHAVRGGDLALLRAADGRLISGDAGADGTVGPGAGPILRRPIVLTVAHSRRVTPARWLGFLFEPFHQKVLAREF